MDDLLKRVAGLSPEKRALLVARLKKGDAGAGIPRRRDAAQWPLSFAQQRLWFLDQYEPGSPLYNVPSAFRMRGPLDARALERSLEEIIRRHETLRTTFPTSEGRAVQRVSPPAPPALQRLDLAALPPDEREARAEQIASEEARLPFDLSVGPLLRLLLLRLSEEEHVLLLSMHHIISDGWSVGVLLGELSQLYGAYASGRPSPLPELPIQYTDFAVWQRESLESAASEQRLDYWRRRLEGAPPSLDLPTVVRRPAALGFRGSYEELVLPSELSESLKALGRRHDATLFMTLLAAFRTLLRFYTGQDDLCIGTPVSGRTHAEIQGLIGFFINALVLRLDAPVEQSFRGLLSHVRRTVVEAFAHQDVPFEMVVDAVQPERVASRTPLFQIMFALQNARMDDLRLEGLNVSMIESHSGTSKFDMTLAMREESGGLRASLEYNSELFDAATIARMLSHFRNLLTRVVTDPDAPLSSSMLLDEKEERQLLVEFNDTRRPYPSDSTIHELFSEQARLTPEAMAVVYGQQRLTYSELDSRSDSLAAYLRLMGVGRESVVGVLMERCAEMVVALLGVLKAGGAYLPLDVEYPQSRLSWMLEDSGARVLLTLREWHHLAPEVAGLHVLSLDSQWDEVAAPQDGGSMMPSPVTPDNLA
jgi:hypothetical protein